ncbi:hypothetical protein PGIGA_G00077050 [Pangasianodon gigas]|uniref:Uncharacterized protein n=1 Tax=Pangasianodon gigas TaxID=30993 RepID=A0ACC5X977_PANGG|nr:hypothetical protein [Pangasianodon gigas]
MIFKLDGVHASYRGQETTQEEYKCSVITTITITKGTRTDEKRTRFLSSRTLVSSFILGEAGKVSTTAGTGHKWVLRL